RIGIVDGPYLLLRFIDKNRGRTPLDALLRALRARPGVLGAAHRVGDPAVEGLGIGRAGRHGAETDNRQGYRCNAFHLKPPGKKMRTLTASNHAPQKARTTSGFQITVR